MNHTKILIIGIIVVTLILSGCTERSETENPQDVTPVTVEDTPSSQADETGAGTSTTVTALELKTMMDEEADIVIIDVRPTGNRTAATIKGSLRLPLGELRNRLDEIKTGVPVVIFADCL